MDLCKVSVGTTVVVTMRSEPYAQRRRTDKLSADSNHHLGHKMKSAPWLEKIYRAADSIHSDLARSDTCHVADTEPEQGLLKERDLLVLTPLVEPRLPDRYRLRLVARHHRHRLAARADRQHSTQASRTMRLRILANVDEEWIGSYSTYRIISRIYQNED